MTREEIDSILQDTRSQDSDFEEPNYQVWYEVSTAGYELATEKVPLFLARLLKRELEGRGYQTRIEVV